MLINSQRKHTSTVYKTFLVLLSNTITLFASTRVWWRITTPDSVLESWSTSYWAPSWLRPLGPITVNCLKFNNLLIISFLHCWKLKNWIKCIDWTNIINIYQGNKSSIDKVSPLLFVYLSFPSKHWSYKLDILIVCRLHNF